MAINPVIYDKPRRPYRSWSIICLIIYYVIINQDVAVVVASQVLHYRCIQITLSGIYTITIILITAHLFLL